MMTEKVVTVLPETSIVDAVKILIKNNFHGLPVVEKNNVLVGIFTEYDLMPTVQNVVQNLSAFGEGSSEFRNGIRTVKNLRVKDVMNKEPLTFLDNANFDEVIKTFREHHRVNPIPVIDSQKKLVGVVSRFDVVKLFDLLGA